MNRTALGVIVGGVVYFVWGAVSWMVLPWHNATIKALPEEQLIMDTLKIVVKDSGVYAFPSERPEAGAISREEFSERFKKGPTGFLSFHAGGREPMTPTSFLISFVVGFVVAFMGLVIFTLSQSRLQGLVSRVALMAFIGAVAAVVIDGGYWNWFGFPMSYFLVSLIDQAVGFALVGAAISKFVPSDI